MILILQFAMLFKYHLNFYLLFIFNFIARIIDTVLYFNIGKLLTIMQWVMHIILFKILRRVRIIHKYFISSNLYLFVINVIRYAIILNFYKIILIYPDSIWRKVYPFIEKYLRVIRYHYEMYLHTKYLLLSRILILACLHNIFLSLVYQ